MPLRILLLICLFIPASLLSQPINDDCTGAVVAAVGMTPFDITSATDSSVPPDDSLCSDALLGQLHRDLWWSFTPDISGLLTVSTCDSADFDSDIAIYSGGCSNMQLIGCNGDAEGCSLFTSHVADMPVAAGQELLIRVVGTPTPSVAAI